MHTVIDRGLDAVIANLTGVIGPYDFTPSRHGRGVPRPGPGQVPRDHRRRLRLGRPPATSPTACSCSRRRAARARTTSCPATTRRSSTLAKLAAEVTGLPAPRLTVPMAVAKLAAPRRALVGAARPAPSPCSRPSRCTRWPPTPPSAAQKATRELGHYPRPTQQTRRRHLRLAPRDPPPLKPSSNVLASADTAAQHRYVGRRQNTDAAGFPLWR